MNYKQKYKDALERAKVVYYDHRKDKYWQNWLTELFPELKENESEGEKIRKALISILKSDFEKDTTIFGISIEQIIAWLEKQDEKKELKEIEVATLDADNILSSLGNNQVQDILEDIGMLDDNGRCPHTAEEIFKAGMEYAFSIIREADSNDS